MAKTPDFKYAPMFQIERTRQSIASISKEGVSTAEFEGKTILKVSKEALTLLAQQGFHDVEFKLRREHNLQVARDSQRPRGFRERQVRSSPVPSQCRDCREGHPPILPGYRYCYHPR